MKNRIWQILALVFSLILTAGVTTVFRACEAKEDGSWMHCHTAQTYVMYIGIALVVLSVAALLVKSAKVGAIIALIQAILAVIAILVPGRLVSMCMMTDMRCWSVMKPAVTVVSVLILIVSLLACVTGFRKRR